jgi:hypothetical protein
MNQSTPSGQPSKRHFNRYSLIILAVLVLLAILGHIVPITSKSVPYSECGSNPQLTLSYRIVRPVAGYSYEDYKLGNTNGTNNGFIDARMCIKIKQPYVKAHLYLW